MAEIAFSVLTRDCLRGRHGDDVALAGTIKAYEIRRNVAKAIIEWRFSTDHARTKLHRLYPCNSWIEPVLEDVAIVLVAIIHACA